MGAWEPKRRRAFGTRLGIVVAMGIWLVVTTIQRFPGAAHWPRARRAAGARGLSNAEIAHGLVVGETTVKTHVSKVLMKLARVYERSILKTGQAVKWSQALKS